MLRALLITLVLWVISSELPAQERYTVSYGGLPAITLDDGLPKDLRVLPSYGLNADPDVISGSPREYAGSAFRQQSLCVRKTIDA